MYHIKQVSPMIPSFDIGKTVAFFTELLGFRIARKEENYVILYKDQASVHILQAGKDIGQMEFYLEVEAIDPLWENIKDRLDGIKVKPPFDQSYGMREIHIGIPETNTLLFIGQET